ncbi:MAG: recombinase family protein, partial [Bacillota bacterium]
GLREWLAQYKADWKRNQKATKKVDPLEFLNKSLAKLEKDLEEIDKQKNSLHDFLEKGIYSTETFLERSKILADRTDAAEKAIQEVKSRIEAERNIYTANEKIIPLLENIIDVYYKTDDPGQRNALLKSVLNYATYRKEKHQKDDDFTLVLYPKLQRNAYKFVK